MIGNYLTVALRNLVRHKLYSFINIAGLTVGFVCAIFISLFVRDELSYDKWIADSQNIYRVESVLSYPGRDDEFDTLIPFPVIVAMQAQIPGVTAVTHLIPQNMTAQVGDRQFPARIDVVDPDFFQMIRLPLVAGNPATVLAQPESVVLSQTTAREYFGTADPIGRSITVRGSHVLKVTGILRDLPHNTELFADLVIPNTSQADPMSPLGKANWLNDQGWGYVKLAPGTDPQRVTALVKTITDRSIDVKKLLNFNLRGSDIVKVHLTRIRSVHLDPFGETVQGSWTMIYGFFAIAALILLIACFNFMNLATARAMVRAHEISLRKVMGARRDQLIVQLLGESVVTALVALVFALALVEMLLPAYDGFLNRPIMFNVLADWPLTISLAGVAIVAGLLGGIYPALVLSGFRPARTLGTAGSRAGGSGILRSGLVVLQFAISIGLGIAAAVIFAQLRYGQQMNIGFDRHNLVVIGGEEPVTPSVRDALKQTLAAEPSIAGVAASNMVPFGGGDLVSQARLPDGVQQFTVRQVNIDPDFLQIYGIKLLAGRKLSRQRGEDVYPDRGSKQTNLHANILITAAAARLFGFTSKNAVGQTIFYQPRKVRCSIVGVVDDTTFDGLQTPMPPIIYFNNPNGQTLLSIRIRPGQTEAALAAIDRIWHRLVPTVAMGSGFLDDSFEKQFTDNEKQAGIFTIFVGVAIFIACLGLFGLAAFTAGRRTKEIGIRKTFGAPARDLVTLLLWQFTIPVLIANAIAWPVAWYYLHNWLQGFAYRISLSPIYFLGAGASALIIAWATVFVHARRVANANPIHALRTE
jgi:putative ABC transport system permease protein